VRTIIDHWVVMDTGSTDGTQDIVRAHLADLPGELYERPWRDFAQNRSEALDLARPHGDYSLIIDADDILELPEAFEMPELTADAYIVDMYDAHVRYQRIQLVRNTLPWRYRGILHEFPSCEGAGPSGHLPLVMRRNHDGSRRRDPETYRKDAAILEDALATETDPFLVARYTFYLAQSYRDCGEKTKALEAYLRRAELDGTDDEVYYSLYIAAQLKEELGHDHEDVLALYLRASDVVPGRAEALYRASRLCRDAGRHRQAYEIAKRGVALPRCPVASVSSPGSTIMACSTSSP
jgi:Glycosyltransferases involved in cell wall biogenesis